MPSHASGDNKNHGCPINTDVEDPEADAWTRLSEYTLRRPICGVRPQTHCPLRVFCTVVQLAVLGISIASAAITIYLCPRLYATNPLLFWFMIVTLVGEICLLLVIGAFLSGLRLCVGPHNVNHALAMSAVSMKCWQGILCYASLGVGVYILAISYPYNKNQMPISALVYVGLEILLALNYFVRSLDGLWGILKFICHKIHVKLRRHPIVQFQRRYSGDEGVLPTYAEASGQQYATQLANMMNYTNTEREEIHPLVHEGHA
eukprot:Selendium_serpulae@DN4281_c0_g1_i1.p1